MAKTLAKVAMIAGAVALIATGVGAVGVGIGLSAATAATATSIAGYAGLAAPVAQAGSQLKTRGKKMSAINAMCFEDSAYLATDSGVVSFDGKIVALAGKTVAIPDWRMAIAFQGTPNLIEFSKQLNKLPGVTTRRDIINGMPEALRRTVDQLNRDNPESKKTNVIRLWIASYDEMENRPRCYLICSDSFMDFEPYTVTETSGYSVPAIDAAAVLPDGYIENPVEDMRKVMVAQRGHKFEHLGGAYGVAGKCQLTVVSADGITQRDLIEFPEQVGEMVNPALDGIYSKAA